MKSLDPATIAYLSDPGGKQVRVLAYVWAKRRDTGAVEEMGLWSGVDDRSFAIDGGARVYYRAAGLMQMDEILMQPGTDVAFTAFRLSPIDPAVKLLLNNYDLRFAPVEIHRALFWPETGALVAAPDRLFQGWIDGAPTSEPEPGADAELTLSLASANLALSRTMAFKKSDPAQSAARLGDRFRRYVDVGSVIVPWGERRAGSRPVIGEGALGRLFGRGE